MKAIGRALALGGLLLAAGGGSAVAGESAWDGPPAGSPPGYDRFERPEFRASMAKGIAAQSAAEEARETPAAEELRERSGSAFEGYGRTDALSLARAAFPDLMRESRDGLGLRAGERVTGFRSRNIATVEDADGRASLILGSDPLAARADGRFRRIDLTLRSRGEVFEPALPGAAVEIPKTADEFVTVGESGFGLRADDASATAGSVAQDRVFYPEVGHDTDFVATPTRAGAQVMWQLRSAESPERLDIDVDLPEGASLRLAAPVAAPGGLPEATGDVEIVRDGVVLNTISAPVAVDADGIAVPARFAIDVDGELSIEVPHRGRDLRYPLMVDPEVRDVWGVLEFTGSCGGGTAAFAPGIWGYAHWVSPFTPLCGEEWAGSGRGLYIKSEASTYLNGAVAQWAWNAPSGSYIMSIWFDGLRHGAQGSHLFTGLFGSDAWGSIVNQYQEIAWGQITQYPDSPYRSWSAVVGLFMDGSYHRPGWGWAGVRGVNIRLGDLGVPTVRLTRLSTGHNAEAIPRAPWVNDARTPITVTATANDWGLGLQDVGVERAGGGWYGGPHLTCQGHRASPCPKDWAPTFNLNQLPEGYNQVHTWARDIIDQIGIGAPWIQRIDRGAPGLSLTGDLVVHATDGQLGTQPSIEIKATDGSADSPSYQRSGVRRIRLLRDSTVLEDYIAGEPECDSCSRRLTWTVPITSMTGQHDFTVEAWDYAGNRSVRTFTVMPVSRAVDSATGGGEIPFVPEDDDDRAQAAAGRCRGYLHQTAEENIAGGDLVRINQEIYWCWDNVTEKLTRLRRNISTSIIYPFWKTESDYIKDSEGGRGSKTYRSIVSRDFGLCASIGPLGGCQQHIELTSDIIVGPRTVVRKGALDSDFDI